MSSSAPSTSCDIKEQIIYADKLRERNVEAVRNCDHKASIVFALIILILETSISDLAKSESSLDPFLNLCLILAALVAIISMGFCLFAYLEPSTSAFSFTNPHANPLSPNNFNDSSILTDILKDTLEQAQLHARLARKKYTYFNYSWVSLLIYFLMYYFSLWF